MFRYLLEKEFKLIFRNKIFVAIIFVFPIMALILMPFAANFEIKHTRVTVIDNDHSSYSYQLINRISANKYFQLSSISKSYSSAKDEIEKNDADVILTIDKDFEKNFISGKPTLPIISANAVNGMKGSIGAAYLMNCINEFLSDKKASIAPIQSTYQLKVAENYLFNKTLNYKLFMVPALMVMLLTIICGFLPALNIVGEKENGTIEQINVTPISRFYFILSKLIPYWIIGTFVISIGFLVAWVLYGITPSGNILVCYLFSFVFILTVSGLGLILSNYAHTYHQAMFMMFFFLIILILMSGLFTPIRSMPEWTQWIAKVSPLRYYIEAMRAVYIKGSGVSNLIPQLTYLTSFAIIFNLIAVWSYRKKN